MAWAVRARTGRCSAGRGLARPDRADGLEAVHLGHLQVHQHDVEPAGADRPQRPGAVGDDDDRVPQALEHAHGHLLVDRVVLGQEDAQRRAPRVRGGGGPSAPASPAGDRGPVSLGRTGPSSGRRRGPTGGPAWSGRRRSGGRGDVRRPRGRRRRSAAGGGPRRSRSRLAADPPGQADPVDPGHHAVDQRGGERMPLRGGVAEGIERLDGPRDGRRPGAPARQDLLEDQPVGGVVVHDQDRQVLQAAAGPRRGRDGRRRRSIARPAAPGRP